VAATALPLQPEPQPPPLGCSCRIGPVQHWSCSTCSNSRSSHCSCQQLVHGLTHCCCAATAAASGGCCNSNCCSSLGSRPVPPPAAGRPMVGPVVPCWLCGNRPCALQLRHCITAFASTVATPSTAIVATSCHSCRRKPTASAFPHQHQHQHLTRISTSTSTRTRTRTCTDRRGGGRGGLGFSYCG
jgi:hypothetical protein